MNLHTFLVVLGCCALTTGALDTESLRGPSGEQDHQGVAGLPRPHINTSGQQSAFYAVLGSIPPTSNIVVFRQTFYNGQFHYDTTTGVFHCIVPGVYQFQFSCRGSQNLWSVNLMRNSVGQMQADRISLDQQTLHEGLIIMKVNKGDRVWIQVVQGADSISRSSYFSGHLLFTDD